MKLNTLLLALLLGFSTYGVAHTAGNHSPSQAQKQTSNNATKQAQSGESSKMAVSASQQAPVLQVKYSVAVQGIDSGSKRLQPVSKFDWTFIRQPNSVSILKGVIDETWSRDEQGNVRFERVFHDEKKVVDYYAGELKALNVDTDWSAIASFVDPKALALLRVVGRTTSASGPVIRLRGESQGDLITVNWSSDMQIPVQIIRQTKAGSSIKINFAGPVDATKLQKDNSSYLRFDAADFGDQEYESVVKKSEALDIRSGWRKAHNH